MLENPNFRAILSANTSFCTSVSLNTGYSSMAVSKNVTCFIAISVSTSFENDKNTTLETLSEFHYSSPQQWLLFLISKPKTKDIKGTTLTFFQTAHGGIAHFCFSSTALTYNCSWFRFLTIICVQFYYEASGIKFQWPTQTIFQGNFSTVTFLSQNFLFKAQYIITHLIILRNKYYKSHLKHKFWLKFRSSY